MLVTLNGAQTRIDGIETITGLLDHLELEGRIAVEVNREIVPRSEFDRFTIKDGDTIEIVHAIGGG